MWSCCLLCTGREAQRPLEMDRRLLVMQGVMSPQDARLAVDAGAAGIVVSNHGGRQLDHCAATLDMVNPAVYPQDFAAPIACCGACQL